MTKDGEFRRRELLRRERRRKFGPAFWRLTLQAARVADDASPVSRIFCATFFARRHISIPDQQYRSLRLCHALCAAGIVTRDKTVAIVGAGVSGMTCAVALAARTDCLVHVFEADTVLLRRYREAPFRYLHPNLNTWAATSPINRYNPHTRTLFPVMNWAGDYAPVVADELLRQFRHYRECLGIALLVKAPVLDVFHLNGKPVLLLGPQAEQLTFKELQAKQRLLRRDGMLQSLREHFASDAIEYDVIIVATGFGKEKQPIDSRRRQPIETDYSYWHSGNPAFYKVTGITRRSRRKRILIAGNGDSAIIELAHYLVRDFLHHRIFEFLPLTDVKPELWELFRGVIESLKYAAIEVGNSDTYGLAGPISWYWTQRAARSWPGRPPEHKPWPSSRAVKKLEQQIYTRIDADLAGSRIGESLSSDAIKTIEQAVDGELDALASREIDEAMALIPIRKYYPQAVIASKLSREFFVTVVGPTPTIYSRRQAPLTWYLIRVLREFASHRFAYTKGKLRSVAFADGLVSAEVDKMRSASHFDAIVARLGPDYDSGLVRQLRQAELAVSRYTVAGNPIPGDDYGVTELGPVLFSHEQLSEAGYLAVLRDYFRTRLWRRVIKRGVPLQGNSDEDDRRALWLHWRGNTGERAKAEKLFRAVKDAGSPQAKRRAQDALRLLDEKVSGRRNEERAAQYVRQQFAGDTRRGDDSRRAK